MFGLIKKIFIALLTGLVKGSNHTTFESEMYDSTYSF